MWCVFGLIYHTHFINRWKVSTIQAAGGRAIMGVRSRPSIVWVGSGALRRSPCWRAQSFFPLLVSLDTYSQLGTFWDTGTWSKAGRTGKSHVVWRRHPVVTNLHVQHVGCSRNKNTCKTVLYCCQKDDSLRVQTLWKPVGCFQTNSVHDCFGKWSDSHVITFNVIWQDLNKFLENLYRVSAVMHPIRSSGDASQDHLGVCNVTWTQGDCWKWCYSTWTESALLQLLMQPAQNIATPNVNSWPFTLSPILAAWCVTLLMLNAFRREGPGKEKILMRLLHLGMALNQKLLETREESLPAIWVCSGLWW